MLVKKIYKPLLLLTLVFQGCNDFEDLNTNPNEPTSVSSGVLFSSAIRNSAQTQANESFLLGNNIAQLSAKTLRAEVDFYGWNAFPTVWEGFYESLTDVQQVIDISIETGDTATQGAAIIYKSWIYSVLTNAYGDIPYSEAMKGLEANFTPAYDSQEAIYADLLSSLEQAVGMLSNGGSVTGDLLYDGDTQKWVRFANSLRLRLLMYQSGKQDVSAAFAIIVNSGNIINSNDNQAAVTFLNSFPNQFPTIPLKQGDFDAVAISKAAVTVMEDLKDPRLSRYARPDNEDFDAPVFTGVENGVGGQTGSRLGLAYFNYPGQITADQMGINYAEGLIMTYSEVCFLVAEGIAKGWVSGDIATEYKKGIQASHDYYQVNYAPYGWNSFEDYYDNSGVAFAETEDIWKQKWLSLYFSGLEPYFELRRWYNEVNGWDGLSFVSAPIGTNLNNYELPSRFLYPGQEQSLNNANYQVASSRYAGGNTINGKMWILQ